VDFEKRVIHVRGRADRFNDIGRPKSATSERAVPMTPVVINAVGEWKLACPKRATDKVDAAGNPAGVLDLVFPNGNGNGESHANIINRSLHPVQIAVGVTVDTGKVDDVGNPVMAAKYIGCVQKQLNALGFDVGAADGSIGPLTRTAAEEYRRWMSSGAGGEGWSQPALTTLNGEQWCRKVAEDHPETARYQPVPVTIEQSYTVSASKGLVATFSLPTGGRISDAHLFFRFKTKCEGDLWAMLSIGAKVVVMDKSLHRCSGTPPTSTATTRSWAVFQR